MENLLPIWQWLKDHPVELLVILGAVHAVASAIANVTPTKADDAIVAAVYRAIHALALNFFHLKSPQAPQEPAVEEAPAQEKQDEIPQ